MEKVVEDPVSRSVIEKVIQNKSINSPPSGYNPTTVSDRLKAFAYNVPPSWMTDANARKAASWSPDSLFTVPLFTADKIYRQPYFPSVREKKELFKNSQITILPLDKEYVEKLLLLLTLQQNFYKEHDKGVSRYLEAEQLFTGAAQDKALSCDFLLHRVSRCLTHGLTKVNLYDAMPQNGDSPVYVPFRDFIPRYITSAAILIQGTKPHEPTALTTMEYLEMKKSI